MWHRHNIDPEQLKQAGIDRATVRRAWGFARPYRGRIALYVGVLIANAVASVLPPLIFKQLIDEAIPAKDFGQVNLMLAAAIGVALLATALGSADRYLGSRIGEGLIFDLRVALYRHVQGMPLAFFTRAQTGSLLTRLNTDVVGAQQIVTTLANRTFDLFIVATTLVAMWALSWRITLLTLVMVPVVIYLDRKLGGRIAGLSRWRMKLQASMNTTMTERFNVSGALLVKLFGRPDAEAGEFADRAAKVRDSGVTIAMASRAYAAALTLAGAVGIAAVYWLGARAAINGSLTIGALVALAAYVQRLLSAPLVSLASARVDLLTALVSFERVFEVLDANHTITEDPDAVTLDRPAGRVEYEDVWFRFPPPASYAIASLEADGSQPADEPSDWILRGITFTAEPGRMIALVGRSGAGKTTLASLLSRIHDVTSGSVRIDGHDVRQLALQSLSDTIGVVSQDPHLFHDSIAANLRYARPEATNDAIVEACKAARIHDVIAALPEGYDTVVGERGYRMSGGEKQRLAIARVLLKRPAIVVLDEATSHLDAENEAAIQRALAAALEGRTSIVIAHRLSTIQAADEILVLEAGRIVERGRHHELLNAGGLYSELYETHFGVGDSPAAPSEAS